MNVHENIRVDYSDDDVRFRVSSYLKSRHFQNLRQIGVAVQNGTVTLEGTVDSFYEKQIALSSCQRVAGVLSMVDHLSVAGEELDTLDTSGVLV